ncbi:MAG: DNA-3-methyladenine glycosylase [Solirubrobacterales bacterium]|nr:DNA-3-methyladenine glycosylase [Solirubrobacterales bacterium]
MADPVEAVAEKLLGCLLERRIGEERVLVRIVETEAYDQWDEASHTFRGVTPRNEVMFGPAGFLYVYFTYGMHYCCNVVTGTAGTGSAVLLRGAEPIEGIEAIERNRGVRGAGATNGPAKLCQALAIDRELNGHDLHESPLKLRSGGLRPEESVIRSTRIGITKATDLVRRFHVEGNPFVSRK